MHRILRAAALFALAGCATTSSSSAPPASDTKAAVAEPQKLAITNVIPFDIAACGPREFKVSTLNTEILTGALLSLSPATQECFVDKANRDGQPFELAAKVTVAEAGMTVELTGTGASASGKACVEAAFKKLTFAAPKAAVVAQLPISAGPQTVSLGDNVANDVAGKLRLAQLQLCGCYASIGNGLPPSLKADVEISAEGKLTANVGGADEISKCVTGKLLALDLGKAATKLTWPLLLKNTYATEVDAAAPAALRFQQLDGMRAQRTGDVMIAAGKRLASALEYDALAKDYKRKPAKGMLEQLKAKCAEVVSGDDAQIASVKSLIGVLEQSQKLVQEEKAKDPQWAQVEPSLAQQLTASTGEVVRIEAQKKNDEGACPKVKY